MKEPTLTSFPESEDSPLQPQLIQFELFSSARSTPDAAPSSPAPGDSQRMAHGVPVELLAELGEEGRQTPEDCFVTRSILGALGNAIVWPVAEVLIRAMIQAEDED